MEKSKEELMKKAIKDSWITNNNGDIEIDADYRDEMEPEDVEKILKAEAPMEYFSDLIFEWYEEALWSYQTDLVKEIEDVFEKAGIDLSKDEIEEVRQYVYEEIGYEMPESHFLGKKFDVNLLVDTGDMNFDFTLNSIFPAYCSGNMNDAIHERSSIAWLLKQQGYSRSQYKGYLRGSYKDNKFLGSIYQELLNVSSHMNQLCVLVKLSLEELIRLTGQLKKRENRYEPWKDKDLGKLVIDRTAMIGLFDECSGAGSILEIELAKDLVLPVKYIGKLQIDGARRRYGYDVGNVYGMCGSAWEKGDVKQIIYPKEKKGAAA